MLVFRFARQRSYSLQPDHRYGSDYSFSDTVRDPQQERNKAGEINPDDAIYITQPYRDRDRDIVQDQLPNAFLCQHYDI